MPENTEGISFPSIKSLICGYMKLNWTDVIQLATIFPEINELRVPFNRIINIDISSDHNLNDLKLLDLEGNHLKEWSEINKLGVLTNLEQLIVTNTAIKLIKIEHINDSKPFENLKQLVVSENLIDAVSFVFDIHFRIMLKFYLFVFVFSGSQ